MNTGSDYYFDRTGWLGHDVEDFAGHSLRAGLATSAAAAGKSERAIMNQTGHRSLKTVRRYIRQGSVFRENAADRIGSVNVKCTQVQDLESKPCWWSLMPVERN